MVVKRELIRGKDKIQGNIKIGAHTRKKKTEENKLVRSKL